MVTALWLVGVSWVHASKYLYECFKAFLGMRGTATPAR
jgi:hypothetical protein